MGNAKKKSFLNIFWGIVGQIVTLAFGLIVPRLIISNYGSEANGLTTSITQIYAYVALLEAGVGGATLQALYKTVGANDKKATSSILSATNIYYKRTGIIYIFAVCVLSFVYPFVTKSELNYWVVFGVVFFNGMGGAINFLFQGKYYLLLQAEGKNYIKTNLTTILHAASGVTKVLLVYLGLGIVELQAAYFLLNIAQMVYILVYIRGHYQWLDVHSEPDFNAISQKNSVMVHQVSALIFGNTDAIILTILCGLKSVSVYSLISTFITYVNGILNNVSSGILFSLGQNYHNDRKRFQIQYNVFEMIYIAMTAFCLTLIYIFLNPFLALYTSGINDISYVDPFLPLLFVISFFLTWVRVPSIYVINNCAGHFKETQWRSILESVINIAVSIVGAIFLGVYGVLLGTIIALLYRTNDMIIYSAKYILKRCLWDAYKRIVINTVWMIFACVFGSLLLPRIDSYFLLLVWVIIYALIVGAVDLLINYLTGKQEFKYAISLLFRRK